MLKRRTILSLNLLVEAMNCLLLKHKAEFKNYASALNNKEFVDSALKELKFVSKVLSPRL